MLMPSIVDLHGDQWLGAVEAAGALYLPRMASVQVAGPVGLQARPWPDRGRGVRRMRFALGCTGAALILPP
jgi:hypothetical protein